MPSIYSGFDEYDEGKVLMAYLNKHYRGAFRTEEEVEFLKKPSTPERKEKGDQIKARVTERMLENIDKLRVARCPKCNCILETPRARQCLWCKHKFHDMPRPQKQVKRTFEVEVETSDREGEQQLQITQVRVRSKLQG